MTKEEMLKLKDSPSGRYGRVGYSKLAYDHVNIPAEILEHDPEFEDEDLADWIAENNDDAEDIQITSIS
jgi:hypothetical protein